MRTKFKMSQDDTWFQGPMTIIDDTKKPFYEMDPHDTAVRHE